MHNAIFDMMVWPLIPEIGEDLDTCNIWDTSVAARLLGYLEVELSLLAPEVGRSTTPARVLIAQYSNKVKAMAGVPAMEVAKHCMDDALTTYGLYLKFKDKIDQRYGGYFRVEMDTIPILVEMSQKGILIDQKKLIELVYKYTAEAEFYLAQCQAAGIENPASSQQVGYILSHRGNFLKVYRGKKNPTTDEEALQFLDDPLAQNVLGYRKSSRFLSTYLMPSLGLERFNTEYYIETSVGRINSRNRNIQNIPDERTKSGMPARSMFMPDSGMFTTGDYSRLHMYILAHMSGDRTLLDILYDPDPEHNDIHQRTADLMGTTRNLAKTLNYAVVYGATAKTISEQAKLRDLARCQHLLDSWFGVYKGVSYWIQEVQREGLRSGWAVPTLFGRRIRLPVEDEDSMKRKAVNFPIIGSDSEIIKRAMIMCNRRKLGPPIMSITLHDGLTFDGDVQLPVGDLELIPGFRVPFEVKRSKTWE